MIDWQIVGQIGGSLAGFAVVGKWLMRGVEKSNETLPVIAESLKTMNDGMKVLFDSRHDHEKRLERVETIQEIRGCHSPIERK